MRFLIASSRDTNQPESTPMPMCGPDKCTRPQGYEGPKPSEQNPMPVFDGRCSKTVQLMKCSSGAPQSHALLTWYGVTSSSRMRRTSFASVISRIPLQKVDLGVVVGLAASTQKGIVR